MQQKKGGGLGIPKFKKNKPQATRNATVQQMSMCCDTRKCDNKLMRCYDSASKHEKTFKSNKVASFGFVLVKATTFIAHGHPKKKTILIIQKKKSTNNVYLCQKKEPTIRTTRDLKNAGWIHAKFSNNIWDITSTMSETSTSQNIFLKPMNFEYWCKPQTKKKPPQILNNIILTGIIKLWIKPTNFELKKKSTSIIQF